MTNLLGAIVGELGQIFQAGPDFILALGPVEFRDHEIPASITAGGDQTMSVHKYPGGTRTIDTFGPDDHEITWSGTFTDLDAEDRCQMLDILRRDGLPLPLIWSTYFYDVVIKSFNFTYERFWQIPYTITLTVMQDNNNPPTDDDSGDSFDDQINSDASSASGNVASMGALSYP